MGVESKAKKVEDLQNSLIGALYAFAYSLSHKTMGIMKQCRILIFQALRNQ